MRGGRYSICVEEEEGSSLLCAHLKWSYRSSLHIQRLLRYYESHDTYPQTIYSPDYSSESKDSSLFEGEVPVWIECDSGSEAEEAAVRIREGVVSECRKCGRGRLVSCDVCSNQHSCAHVRHLHSTLVCVKWDIAACHTFTCRLCNKEEQCYHVQDIEGCEDDVIILMLHPGEDYYGALTLSMSRAVRKLYIVTSKDVHTDILDMLYSAAGPHTQLSTDDISCPSVPCPHIARSYLQRLTLQQYINTL